MFISTLFIFTLTTFREQPSVPVIVSYSHYLFSSKINDVYEHISDITKNLINSQQKIPRKYTEKVIFVKLGSYKTFDAQENWIPFKLKGELDLVQQVTSLWPSGELLKHSENPTIQFS